MSYVNNFCGFCLSYSKPFTCNFYVSFHCHVKDSPGTLMDRRQILSCGSRNSRNCITDTLINTVRARSLCCHLKSVESLVQCRWIYLKWKRKHINDDNRTIATIVTHMWQNRHVWEQGMHWEKTNKGNYLVKWCELFVSPAQVHPLHSMVVWHHLND